MNRRPKMLARFHRLLVSCALVWLAAPTTAEAQEVGAYPLEQGNRIRVIPLDGEPIHGRLVRLESSSLVVSLPRDEARLIRAEEVQEVWIAESRAGAFAKGGAILGGLGTAAAGIAVMSAFCQGSTDCNSGEPLMGALVGGAAGAAGGAVLGALVGAMAPRWVRADPSFGGARGGPSLSLNAHVDPGAATGVSVGAAAGASLEPVLSLSLSLPAPR